MTGRVSYQVFARKYRPQTFADVLGQDHVVRTLSNAIAQNRLAHAYLFVGPRGTGKTSTARIFAKALNCPGGPSIDFDPNAPICQEIAEGRSLDVLEIDGASNNGVEQVRDLRETVKYAPASGRFKIYYIDEVHMLSNAAFNALLKTLEEPPPHVKFIFATTEANKILPTIISRCQRFDLRRIPDPIIANQLLNIARLENIDLEEKAAYAIAKGADGGMRDSQSMLDQLVAFCGEKIVESDVLDMFGFTPMEAVSGLARHLLARDTVGALRFVTQQSEAGKDLGRLLSDIIQHFRTLLVHQTDAEAALENLAPEMAQEVAAQSQSATPEQLLRLVDGFAELDARMRWASNKRLHFELGVIQAVQSLNDVSLSDVIDAIDKAGGTAADAAHAVQARRAVVPIAPPPAIIVEPKRVAPATAPKRDDDPAPVEDSGEEQKIEPVAPVAKVAAPEPVKQAPAPVVVREPEPMPVQEDRPESREPVYEDGEPRPEDREPDDAPPWDTPANVQRPAPTVQPRAESFEPRNDPREQRAENWTPPSGDMLFGEAELPESRRPSDDIWRAIFPEVQRKKPLIAHWLQVGTQLAFKNNVLKVGFPESETHSCDSLKREATRRFLEDVASEIHGAPVKLDLVVDPTLHAPEEPPAFVPQPLQRDPAPAPQAALQREPERPAPKPEPKPEAKPEPEPINEAEFYDDPLIKAAVEKIKARIIKPT